MFCYFRNSTDEAHGDIYAHDYPHTISNKSVRAVMLKIARELIRTSDRFRSRITPDNHWQLCEYQAPSDYIRLVELPLGVCTLQSKMEFRV